MSIGCCAWSAFLSDFPEHYAKWFDAPLTPKVWAAAKKDWRSGNTPWEAAHNAQRRAKARVVRASSKPLPGQAMCRGSKGAGVSDAAQSIPQHRPDADADNNADKQRDD